MRLATTSLLITTLLGCAVPAVYANSQGDAEKSAKQWLDEIDAGKYDRSWDASSSYFRSKVNKSQWDATLKQQRAPLGRTIARRTKEPARYQTDIAGVPHGQYYIFVYSTDYDKAKNAIDMVTVGWDDQGKSWKGYGYSVISTPMKPSK